MPEKPHNFWQELKRRKVIRVIIGYAAAAYVLLELTSIVAEPLRLPDWTINLVLVLLCIGFVITVIVSWIYDITPKGVVKTESAKMVKQKVPDQKPAKRKLKLSDVIIAVLVVAVVVLAYPKIFKRDKFKNIRNEDGKISVAVMPFENMTNDTLWDTWKFGIQDILITNLSSSRDLSIRSYQTIFDILQGYQKTSSASLTPSIASDISHIIEAKTFILGTIKEAGSIFRISAQLINSDTKDIIEFFQLEGKTEDDIFWITDSLSTLLRNYLEIKSIQDKADKVISTMSSKTNSAEAYRYYVQGYNYFIKRDFSSALVLFNKALKIDPNFFIVRTFKVFALSNQGMHNDAKLQIQELSEQYGQIGNLPYDGQMWLEYLKTYYAKDPQTGIKYLEIILENDPFIRNIWWQKGWEHFRIHQYQESIECFEKALEIDAQWGTSWEWLGMYSFTGQAYHELNNHKREKEIYELGLDILQDNPSIIRLQAICALSTGDSLYAKNLIEKFMAIREKEGLNESQIRTQIGIIYSQAEQFDKAIDIFRKVLSENPQNTWCASQLASTLIETEIDIEEGLELTDKVLKSWPGYINALYAKGLAYFKLGKIRDAYEILKESWDLRPLYHHDHYSLLREVERALDNGKRE